MIVQFYKTKFGVVCYKSMNNWNIMYFVNVFFHKNLIYNREYPRLYCRRDTKPTEWKEWPISAKVCVTKFILASERSWECPVSWVWLETLLALWDGDLTAAGGFFEKLHLSNEQELFLSIPTQREVYFLCQFCQTLTCGTAPNNSTHAWSVIATCLPLTDHGDCPRYQAKNFKEAFPDVCLCHFKFKHWK